MILPMPFFSSSSDKGISRGTVNFRYVNFTYGQIEGLDYIATVEGFLIGNNSDF